MPSTEVAGGPRRSDPVRAHAFAVPAHAFAVPAHAFALVTLGLGLVVLEAGLVRVLSFKLDAFAVPALLGVCLLGVGLGARAVARAGGVLRPDAFAGVAFGGSLAIALGYLLLARLDVETTDTLRVARGLLPLAVGWASLGALAAALLGAGSRRLAQQQAALLAGLAVGALLVNPLLSLLGAPRCVLLVAVLVGGVGAFAGHAARLLAGAAGLLAFLVAVIALQPEPLFEPLADPVAKHVERTRAPAFGRWGPLARVEVTGPQGDGVRLVLIDGRWSGTLEATPASEAEIRSGPGPGDLAHVVAGTRPRRVVVLGVAGGVEVRTALAHGALAVEAVEEVPLVHSLLTDAFADWSGGLARHPRVTLRRGSVRGWLASGDEGFDVVVLTAPRAFAAQTLPHASAHLPQESHLLTVEAVAQMLRRLRPGGVLAARFGEEDWEERPLRTARFVATVREALRRLEATDPAAHVVVVTTPGFGRLATVLVKRSPFSDVEVERLLARIAEIPGAAVQFAAGWVFARGLVVDELLRAERLARERGSPGPVSDDSPFFWHWPPDGDASAQTSSPARLRGQLLPVAAPAAALLALALALAGPRAAGGARSLAPGLGLFLLGLGFAGCEIALAQKLAPALGDPLRLAGLTLPAFFASVAGGCSLAPRARERWGSRAPFGAFTLVAAGAAGAALALPAIGEAGLAATGAGGVLIVLAVTLPVGLGLGVLVAASLGARADAAASPAAGAAGAWAALALAFAAGTLLAPLVAMGAGLSVLLGAAVAVLGLGVVLQSPWSLPPGSARAGARRAVRQAN